MALFHRAYACLLLENKLDSSEKKFVLEETLTKVEKIKEISVRRRMVVAQIVYHHKSSHQGYRKELLSFLFLQ